MRTSKIIKVQPGANAGLSADCPAVVAYRVSWSDELLIRGTLGDIRAKAKGARITHTALVLVGRAISGKSATESRLSAADHHHSMRRA
jgi:precorrin-4/cobalt-precorrin-4 C11-methyltransferase